MLIPSNLIIKQLLALEFGVTGATAITSAFNAIWDALDGESRHFQEGIEPISDEAKEMIKDQGYSINDNINENLFLIEFVLGWYQNHLIPEYGSILLNKILKAYRSVSMNYYLHSMIIVNKALHDIQKNSQDSKLRIKRTRYSGLDTFAQTLETSIIEACLSYETARDFMTYLDAENITLDLSDFPDSLKEHLNNIREEQKFPGIRDLEAKTRARMSEDERVAELINAEMQRVLDAEKRLKTAHTEEVLAQEASHSASSHTSLSDTTEPSEEKEATHADAQALDSSSEDVPAFRPTRARLSFYPDDNNTAREEPDEAIIDLRNTITRLLQPELPVNAFSLFETLLKRTINDADKAIIIDAIKTTSASFPDGLKKLKRSINNFISKNEKRCNTVKALLDTPVINDKIATENNGLLFIHHIGRTHFEIHNDGNYLNALARSLHNKSLSQKERKKFGLFSEADEVREITRPEEKSWFGF